jgi:hypothetical protein
VSLIFLKLVEVEHQHGDRIALQILGVAGELVGRLEQRAPVGEPRQRIGQGEGALL